MLLLKIGGGTSINFDFIAKNVASLIKKGEQIVIVHGGNVTRDEIGQQLGVPTKTIISPSGISSVYTDEKAIDVFLMAYPGLVNKKLVVALQRHGVNALGLSGVDGKLWQAKRKKAVYSVEDNKTKLIKNNLTGKVTNINSDLIKLLLKQSYVPVICPPALSEENEIINTDNDFAVAIMAETLGITEIVVLFEAPGMLKNVSDKRSLIARIQQDELDDYLQYCIGGMKKKLLGAQEAFKRGVQKIYWGDGRIEQPVTSALKGEGTVIE